VGGFWLGGGGSTLRPWGDLLGNIVEVVRSAVMFFIDFVDPTLFFTIQTKTHNHTTTQLTLLPFIPYKTHNLFFYLYFFFSV
jgi:hypothetical protein